MKVLILLSLLVISVTSYPNGAPPGSCVSMVPAHGVDAQNSQSPFLLTAAKSGNNVMITIAAKSGDKFEGFLLQARDMSGMPVGNFSSSNTLVKTMGCIGGMQNAATHNSNAHKTIITLLWTPPVSRKDVNFTLTIVRSGSVFWVKQMLPYKINSTSPKEEEEIVLENGDDVDLRDTGYVVASSSTGSQESQGTTITTTKSASSSTDKPSVVSVPTTGTGSPKSDATISMCSTTLIFVLTCIQRYLL